MRNKYDEDKVVDSFKKFFIDNPTRIYPSWELLKESFPTSGIMAAYGERTLVNISSTIIEDKKYA